MKTPPQYKSPVKQRSIEEHTQRTPPVEGAPEEQRSKEDNTDAATRIPSERRARAVVIGKRILF